MKRWILAIGGVLVLSVVAWGQGATLTVPESAAKENAVTKPLPEYPILAKQMRVAGRVEVSAFIDAEGNVEKTQVVSGNALLTSAASAALKKWKFTPFNSDGKPCRAQTTISFEFKL